MSATEDAARAAMHRHQPRPAETPTDDGGSLFVLLHMVGGEPISGVVCTTRAAAHAVAWAAGIQPEDRRVIEARRL